MLSSQAICQKGSRQRWRNGLDLQMTKGAYRDERLLTRELQPQINLSAKDQWSIDLERTTVSYCAFPLFVSWLCKGNCVLTFAFSSDSAVRSLFWSGTTSKLSEKTPSKSQATAEIAL